MKYWHFGVLAILFMVCEVTVDMIQPKLMATIVDDGILGLGGSGRPDLDLIMHTGLIMILIVLAGGLAGTLSGVMANLCSQRFSGEIRKKCFARIMRLSFEQTDAFTTGSLITRITNDVTQLERLVQQSVRGFVRCLMFMVVGTITLLSLNQHFLVILAIAFPLVLIDIIFILWRTNPLFLRLQQRIDDMNTVIRENINGARVVKAFIQEDREEGRFAGANQALVSVQLRILILMSYLRPVMNIVLNLATVALIWIGAIHVRGGDMMPGEIMAAVTYISQILNGMMMLAMIFQTLSRGTASYRRLKEVLDTEPVIRDGASAKAGQSGVSAKAGESGASAKAGGSPAAHLQESSSDTAPAVEFRNVRFRYPTRSSDADAMANSDTADGAGANGTIPGGTLSAAESASRAGIKAASDTAAALGKHIPVSRAIREIPAEELNAVMEDDGSVLRDISLRIEAGETLAIIGATGCGKTSLVSLIPRFYDATEGSVLVRGRDVRSGSLKDLRDGIAFVPQKNELFSTTIRDNILIGRPGATEEEMRFAAQCAQADDFILAQPQGYDTPVAEGGMSLSGGQRQRIAIARALLKLTGMNVIDPAGSSLRSGILILDDSTSALDLKTEAALYDALQAHFSHTTRIVIAQRITTARRADRIAVMDHGRLVGCGTHAELMESCSVYQDICSSQEGGGIV